MASMPAVSRIPHVSLEDLMNAENMTVKTRAVYTAAQAKAADSGHADITPEHFMAALFAEEEGLPVQALGRLNIEPQRAQKKS